MDPCFEGFKNIYKIKISQICDNCKIGEFLQNIRRFSRTYTSRKTEISEKNLIFWFKEIDFFGSN